MDLTIFDESFEKYIDSITPTETQSKKIEEALHNVAAAMLSAFPDAEIYAQGSYSTDTMSKPLTAKQADGNAGEYDVDIVVESLHWNGAAASLNEVHDVLLDHGTYGGMELDNTKNSCVRINYADDATGVRFHVDLVPTLNTAGERRIASRADDAWKPSDAKQFADYFNTRANDYPTMRQVAVILKRLRDQAGLNDEVKSILILTLVDNDDGFYANGSIMGDLVATMTSIASKFSSSRPPHVPNPVNEGEDLMARVDNYDAVRKFFIELNDDLTEALTDQDYDALTEIFGSGFQFEEKNKNKKEAAAVVATSVAPTRAFGGSDVSNNV